MARRRIRRASPRKPPPGGRQEQGKGLLWLILAAFAPHALGLIWPDYWWGSHWLAFLPLAWTLATAALALAVLFSPLAFSGRRRPELPGLPRFARRRLLLVILAALGYGLLCHALHTATDIYGDARRNLQHVEQALATGNPGWASQFLNPNLLRRETGEGFVLNLVWMIAAGLGLSARSAFDLFNALCGFAYALTWISLVLDRLRGTAARWLLILTGLFAGHVALFTDHAEIYGPAVVLLLLFLATADRCLRTRERGDLLLLALLFLLAAKAHFANLALAVPLIVIFAEIMRGREAGISTRGRMAGAVLPLLGLLFLWLYFFVMKNHAVSRFVDDIGRSKTFFLPLIHSESFEAPAYTLFSAAHVLDFLNVVLSWSLPALLILLAVWIRHRPSLQRAPAGLVMAELTLLLYLGIFFVTNPVLGMPRDWDLFSIPAPALLYYALRLSEEIPEERPLPGRLLGAGFALLVLALPAFAVNHSPRLLAPRLESIGVHSYRTYWKGATYLLNVSAELGAPDSETVLERREGFHAKLRPHALPADAELADLAWRISILHRERGAFERAWPYAMEAARLSLGNELCLRELCLVQIGLEEYAEAFKTAARLVAMKPGNASYLDLAFRSAINAGNRQGALAYGEQYLRVRPEDTDAANLIERIRSEKIEAPPVSAGP